MPAVWTDTQIVNNLLREGAKWSGQTVTYGFPGSAPSWSFTTGEGSGFSALSAAQKDMARHAMKMWDDLITVDFVETTVSPKITFQNSTTNVGYAHAYMPTGSVASGAVWFNPTYNSTWGTNDLVTPKIGQWGALAYMHELGHALGLDHPGEYNGGSPTYANDALYTADTIQYTIMSYFGANNTGADWIASDGKAYYAQTPMVHDVLAIQALYGAEMTTRTGDTRYGFNSNADSAIYDFTQNKHPIMTLWDAGGTDWLDLSGFNTASRIDLNPGAFSDCDAMTKNIAIAYGCIIENAAGGSGNDNILGNSANNILVGNGGDDILNGGAGADILIGGDGNDKLYADSADLLLQFDGGAGYDILYFSGTLTYVFDYAIRGIEEMIFLDGGPSTPPPAPPPPPAPTVINGTAVANTLNGSDAVDIINGLAGNDTLNGLGGNDTLNGGAGNDRMDGGAGSDTVTYSDATAAVSVNLGVTTAQATGGSGNDTILNVENLTGSAFNDTLTGNAASNRLEGLNGNDRLNGAAGADTLVGGNGNDTYVIDNAGDVADETGTSGIDTVEASVSFSLADGSRAVGQIENLVLTGSGAINATGNALDNTIVGNSAANIIDGGSGNDTLSFAGLSAGATVNLGLTTAQATGYGNDTILNIENVIGSNAADTITGSNANNVLSGGSGNDRLSGGGGADRLIGGAGLDTLTGGDGVDTFVFQSISDSSTNLRDVITDFQDGVDKIDLSAIDAVTGGADNAFTFIGAAAFTRGAGQLQVTVANGNTTVSGDVNGDRVADFRITLNGVHDLHAGDFIL